MSSPITSIPRVWATNTNYSAGPDVGTPSKVDPGSALAAEGFEPGPIAAQHVNYELNGATSAAARYLTLMCKPRFVCDVGSATTMGVVSLSATPQTLCAAIGSAGVQVSDLDNFYLTANAPTSVTTALAAAISGTGNIVVFGFGGNGNSYSTDQGQTWSSPNLLNASTIHGIFSAHANKFFGLYANTVANGTAAASWTAVTVTGAGGSNMSALAVLSDGTLLTDIGIGSYKKSVDNGATWSAAGAPANSGGCTNSGRIAGNGGSLIYHAVLLPGGSYQISSTSDGTTWTVLSTIVSPFGIGWDDSSVANNGPGLSVCPDTGWVFLLAMNEAKAVGVLYASPDGKTWTAPLVLAGVFIDSRSVQASRGRVFLLDANGNLFASDGVGVS